MVADEAVLTGTMRTFLDQDRELLSRTLRESAEQIAASYGATASVVWESSNPFVDNDAALVVELGTLVEDYRDDIPATLIAEDFSRFQRKAPGVLLWLGLGDTPPLHSAGFYIPEETLNIGVDFWIKVAKHAW